MAQTEQELRVQLAACYRIFNYMGWSEMIYNHITVKVPGPEQHFLINPFSLHYSEVKASNLVKVDIDGNIVANTDYAVNPAGIVIHTAIHAARPDIQCIAHTHQCRYGCGLYPRRAAHRQLLLGTDAQPGCLP